MKKVLFVLTVLAIGFASCSQKKSLPKSAYEPAPATSVAVSQPVVQPAVSTDAAGSVVSRTESVKVQGGGLLKKYNIIVGSFQSQTNAQNLKTKLTSQGYQPSILFNEAKMMYRVNISSYDQEAEARLQIQKVKSAFPEFFDAWILIAQ